MTDQTTQTLEQALSDTYRMGRGNGFMSGCIIGSMAAVTAIAFIFWHQDLAIARRDFISHVAELPQWVCPQSNQILGKITK